MTRLAEKSCKIPPRPSPGRHPPRSATPCCTPLPGESEAWGLEVGAGLASLPFFCFWSVNFACWLLPFARPTGEDAEGANEERSRNERKRRNAAPALAAAALHQAPASPVQARAPIRKSAELVLLELLLLLRLRALLSVCLPRRVVCEGVNVAATCEDASVLLLLFRAGASFGCGALRFLACGCRLFQEKSLPKSDNIRSIRATRET